MLAKANKEDRKRTKNDALTRLMKLPFKEVSRALGT
jgi:hypothetical protein